MTNFEKFKQDLTIERLASLLEDSCDEDACDYCNYDRYTCVHDCQYGIIKYLESEVENNG